MAANKHEKFEIGAIKRNEIHGADYNPRKISESAKKKLRKNIKENGIVQPIIVNRRTMTVVGGHQRLDIMDSLERRPDYELTAAFIDVDEKKEAELNIFLNNQAAQGEWDITALGDIKDLFPDIDYVDDLGFDESDIEVMFGEDFLRKAASGLEESYDELTADPVKKAKAAARTNKEDMTSEDYRAMKKGMREAAKAENAEDGSYNLEQADYTLTVVFPNNREKQEFMRKIRKRPAEKYVKSTVFYDIANGVYDISALGGA